MITQEASQEKHLFYKKVFVLLIPMALQNLINVGVSATDVIMLGKVGETSLSACSLAGQILFILTLILFGLTSGAAVLTSQYWGKRDILSIQKILNISLRIAILISVLFTLVTFFFPASLMRIFTSEQTVIDEGVNYLRIVSFSYVLVGITTTYLNIIRSVERVIISSFVYSISLIINIGLNSVLIFGLFGFPALGIQGAAIATLLARIIEFIIVIIYATKYNDTLPFHFKNLLLRDKLLLKDFIQFSSPVIINELMWGLAISANASILGHLGQSVVAANSVAQVARQLATVLTFGVANATAIIVGKAIGQNQFVKARLYASRFVILSLVFGVLGGILILISRPVAIANLSLSNQSQEYFSIMMFVMSYFVIAQAYNTTMIVGIFRAGGDTKIGLYFDVSTMWGFSIILGFLAAFVFHWPITVIYIILTSDELLKIGLTTWRYRSYKWLNNITR